MVGTVPGARLAAKRLQNRDRADHHLRIEHNLCDERRRPVSGRHERNYRDPVGRQPNHTDELERRLLHALSVAGISMRRWLAALPLLAAIAAAPSADAWFLRGSVAQGNPGIATVMTASSYTLPSTASATVGTLSTSYSGTAPTAPTYSIVTS